MPERPVALGRVIVLLGGCCFGTLGIWNDLIVSNGGAAFTVVYSRFVFAGAGFLCLLAVRRAWRLDRDIALRVIAMGALQFAAVYCLFQGFAHAPVSLVVLLFYVYPLVATIGAAGLLGEKLTPRRLVVLGLGLGGIALSVGAPSSVETLGIVLGLCAGLAIGSNVVAGRYVMTNMGASSFDVVPLMFVGPALGLLVFGAAAGIDLSLEPAGWAGVAGLAVIGTLVPTLLFWTGVKLIGAGTASMLSTLEPPVAVLLAYAVLGESLTGLQLLGGALVVCAVVLLSLPGGSGPQGQLAA
jgi:drug/metabolite transporter (DMT)-like permease